MVICHSQNRCDDLKSFVSNLLAFLKDVIEVVGLYSGDYADNLISLKKSMSIEKNAE